MRDGVPLHHAVAATACLAESMALLSASSLQPNYLAFAAGYTREPSCARRQSPHGNYTDRLSSGVRIGPFAW